MIMNDFLSNVEKHMIQFRRRNLNTVNQFKIEMFQARRDIEKKIIKMEFGINQSRFIQDHQLAENISIIPKSSIDSKNDKTISTNHNSRALESNTSDKCQISRFNNQNKENQDPNRRMHTDISIIEEFPVKYDALNINDDPYNKINLDSLKNDESMQINTQEVKKKYKKFFSPSAGWTMSADPANEKPQQKNLHEQVTPFCAYFTQQGQNCDNKENLSFRQDTDLFGFEEIINTPFSRTKIIHQLQIEESNESQNF